MPEPASPSGPRRVLAKVCRYPDYLYAPTLALGIVTAADLYLVLFTSHA